MPDKKKDNLEKRRTYFIPENFADGTGVFGGIIPLRNFIEALIITLPLFYLSIRLPIQALNIRVCVIVLFSLPTFAIGCYGFNGDSLSEFFLYFLRFRKRRRVIRYNPRVKLEFTGEVVVAETMLPREKMLRMLENLQQKGRPEGTESDRYFAINDNIAFEDDIALERKLRAQAAKRRNGGDRP